MRHSKKTLIKIERRGCLPRPLLQVMKALGCACNWQEMAYRRAAQPTRGRRMMMSGSEHHRLELRLGKLLIGSSRERLQPDTFQLGYTPEWQARGFPLSPPLTLDGSASSAQIRRWPFGNLLPENRGLEHLIEALSVSRSNLLPWIHGIGRDVPGGHLLPPARRAQRPHPFSPHHLEERHAAPRSA